MKPQTPTQTWKTNIATWWEQQQKQDTREWVRLSSETGEWVRGLVGRDDLIVTINPDTSSQHAAHYQTGTAQIDINPTMCAPGIPPADITMNTREGRYTHPTLAGAAFHEAAHSRYTNWLPTKTSNNPATNRTLQAALLLEESRAEKHLLTTHPNNRTLLRSAVTLLVNNNPETDLPTRLALLAARADSGVLTASEVADVTTEAVNTYGETVYQQLRAVWLKAHTITETHNPEPILTLAREWLTILDKHAPDREKSKPRTPATPPCHHNRNSDANSETSGDANSDANSDTDHNPTINTIINTINENTATQIAAEKQTLTKTSRAKTTRQTRTEQEKTRTEITELIAKHHQTHSNGTTREGIKGHRPPTPTETATINTLTHNLRKALWRERGTSRHHQQLPPGKLKSAAIIKQAAERQQGLPPTAKPWVATRHTHNEPPRIRLGIICDISGSMETHAENVASCVYIISKTINRLNGTTGTIAFGIDNHIINLPGDNPQHVTTFHSRAGTETPDRAIRTITEMLHLNQPTPGTVNILVIVSDGKWAHNEKQRAHKRITQLAHHNTKILHIGYGHRHQNYVIPNTTWTPIPPNTDLTTTLSKTLINLARQ